MTIRNEFIGRNSSISVILTIFLIGLFSCSTPYEIYQFDEITRSHQTIAILPFDIYNTGVIPSELSEEDLLELEYAEGRAFQSSFSNQLLGSTRRGKNNLRINVQSTRKTNRILEENGFYGREILDEPLDIVAKMLEVDAVVVGSVRKNRLMSDLTSYGIEIGVHILDVLSPHPIWPFVPPEVSKSKEIDSSYTLYDGMDSKTLWSISFQHDADWRQRSNDIIDATTRKAARKFPYRIK